MEIAALHERLGEPEWAVSWYLRSAAEALRYTINTYLSVRYDYAFQLLRTGLDNDRGSRSDIGVVVSY